MIERETQRQGERVGGWSEALAASRWFGAFCIAVSIQAWARSWHVVRKQLGLEKKPKQSWRFTFCFKHGVLLVVPSVISTDWFCPDMHVNTVIREGSENSLLMCVCEWKLLSFSNWIYICLWEENASKMSLANNWASAAAAAVCTSLPNNNV